MRTKYRKDRSGAHLDVRDRKATIRWLPQDDGIAGDLHRNAIRDKPGPEPCGEACRALPIVDGVREQHERWIERHHDVCGRGDEALVDVDSKVRIAGNDHPIKSAHRERLRFRAIRFATEKCPNERHPQRGRRAATDCDDLARRGAERTAGDPPNTRTVTSPVPQRQGSRRVVPQPGPHPVPRPSRPARREPRCAGRGVR